MAILDTEVSAAVGRRAFASTTKVAPDGHRDIEARIQRRTARVGILGLGYAGLPLAMAFARAGFCTTGFDVNPWKVAEVNAGRSPVSSVEHEAVCSLTNADRLVADADFCRLQAMDCIVVCVPTPLDEQRAPDTSYVEAALRTVACHMGTQCLVVLQSSCYPGSTRELALPALQATGRQVGRDFYLAYAPERIDPGNPSFGVNNTPKLVGGITPACTSLAALLFAQVVKTVAAVATPEIAETAKLVENAFRYVNISFVNELAMLCDRLGVDVWQVLDAAATKPFAFMRHSPGPGVGGDCIPVTPLYLEWSAAREHLAMETIRAADRVNERMPIFVVDKLARLLSERTGKALFGAHILIVGVSYKPDLADIRQAPSLRILARLRECGALPVFYDPYVPSLRFGGQELASLESVNGDGFDAAIVVTPHRSIDYERLIATTPLILDAQHALARLSAPNVVAL